MTEIPGSTFRIVDHPIDVGALHVQLHDPAAGACCVFEGRVRNHHENRAVTGLDYEAYLPLAESEGGRIVVEALRHFDVVGIVAVHRVGRLVVGDVAVWVGVSAGHRDAAFSACRHVIDEVKARVPIWKREHYVENESSWLHPAASDP